MKYVLMLIIVGLAAAAALAWMRTPSVTRESVDELLRKECPVGSTKDRVYEFLETRKIRSGAYNAGLDPYVGLPDDEREWKRYIVAWISENPNPAFSKYDIKIYLYFDENYVLTEYKLQQLDNVP